MSDPTRDEIDAKLATVRADGRAEAAALRGEFADIRGGMTTEFVAVRGEMKAGFEALRSEMHKNSSDIIKWVIGTAVGLGVAGITVMAFVLNNAVPKAPVATVQPPIVINVPTSAPPAPAPSLPKP